MTNLRVLLIGLVVLCFSGCVSTTDVSKNPSRETDFAVGQVYQLKHSVWLWQGSITLREIAGSEGVMSAGDRIRVRQVVVFRSPEVGPYTRVYADVLAGEHKGQVVSILGRPGKSEPSYLKRDTQIYELAE